MAEVRIITNSIAEAVMCNKWREDDKHGVYQAFE